MLLYKRGIPYVFAGGKVKLTGRIYKDNKVMGMISIAVEDESLSFRDKLQAGLIEVCKGLGVSVPIWLKVNTYQLAAIQRMTFERDQFMDNKDLKFDKLLLSIE